MDKESPMVGIQQALDHGHVINVKGTATVLGVPTKRVYDQQGTLRTAVSC